MARWLDEANCPVMDFVCYVLHHKPSLPDMNCMTRKSQARKAGKTIFASKLDHFAHLKKEVTSCVEKRSLQSFVSLFSWHYTYTRTPHFIASPGQQFLRIPCETKLFTPQRHGNILMLTSRPLQKRPSAFLLTYLLGFI